jgi:hypothetical protein
MMLPDSKHAFDRVMFSRYERGAGKFNRNY